MRMTRLTALGAATAIALGSSLAAATADDTATQTVTISVVAPLTISFDDPASALVLQADTNYSTISLQNLVEGEERIFPGMRFQNPTGSGVDEARILVSAQGDLSPLSDTEAGRALTLNAILPIPGQTGGIAHYGRETLSWTSTTMGEQELANTVIQGPERTPNFSWYPSGTSGSPTAEPIDLGTFVFTITE